MSTSLAEPVATGSGSRPFRFIAPFLAFLALLFVSEWIPLAPAAEAALRFGLLALVCVVCWPRDISLRPTRPLMSVAIGAGVFLLWIAPDVLVPHYRSGPLFANSLVGHLHSSLSNAAVHNWSVLFWRSARAVLIVPVVEELFWRGWMMRWMIRADFERVPLGAYAPAAFWVTAILFASEHGPYWDVGLATGVIYNLWMIRTRSLADCILMHAVTNAALSAYVIAAGQWQYWQ